MMMMTKMMYPQSPRTFEGHRIFTARRYASAVYAVVVLTTLAMIDVSLRNCFCIQGFELCFLGKYPYFEDI